MMDYITIAGFMLTVFVTGITVGKLAERIDRVFRKLEDEEKTNKNNRR